MTKSRGSGRRKGSLASCYGRWRVVIPDSLRKELEGSYPEVLRRLEDRRATWEADLNSDVNAIYRILREEIVVEEFKIRRTRVGDYRFLFEVILDECLVRFLSLDITPRRSKVYDRLRKRKL